MQTWEAGNLVANGVRLHYERTRTGKRPLVFAHGLTDQGRCWLPLAEPLAGDYEIVIYDARGHGQSEAPGGGYTYDALADDMAALIGALDLRQPVLIGHSMGAATAALAAARYPGLARAIVLEDPPGPSSFADADRAATAEQWRADIMAEKALDREALLAFVRRRSPLWSEAELGPWADAKQQVNPAVLSIVREPGSAWYELIGQVACPILLLTGDVAAGALISPEFAESLAQTWRAGRVAHIPGAGHCIHRDRFEPSLSALRAFLAEVDR